MDVREKLELIAHLGDHITYKEDIGICYDSALAKVIEDAYMELKNGVTVQDESNEIKQLRNQVAALKKSNRNWRRKVQRMHNRTQPPKGE